MKYLAVLLFMMVFPLVANAEEHKRDNDCKCVKECLDDCRECDQCRDCRIKNNLENRKKLAAEEAKLRKIRLHLRKGKPNIIVIIRPPVVNRGNVMIHHRHHHHHHFDRWGGSYYRHLRPYGTIYRTNPLIYHIHRDRASKVETPHRPKVWYDGLRTRTD